MTEKVSEYIPYEGDGFMDEVNEKPSEPKEKLPFQVMYEIFGDMVCIKQCLRSLMARRKKFHSVWELENIPTYFGQIAKKNVEEVLKFYKVKNDKQNNKKKKK